MRERKTEAMRERKKEKEINKTQDRERDTQ